MLYFAAALPMISEYLATDAITNARQCTSRIVCNISTAFQTCFQAARPSQHAHEQARVGMWLHFSLSHHLVRRYVAVCASASTLEHRTWVTLCAWHRIAWNVSAHERTGVLSVETVGVVRHADVSHFFHLGWKKTLIRAF